MKMMPRLVAIVNQYKRQDIHSFTGLIKLNNTAHNFIVSFSLATLVFALLSILGPHAKEQVSKTYLLQVMQAKF